MAKAARRVNRQQSARSEVHAMTLTFIGVLRSVTFARRYP
jgi:hypothetical protein